MVELVIQVLSYNESGQVKKHTPISETPLPEGEKCPLYSYINPK